MQKGVNECRRESTSAEVDQRVQKGVSECRTGRSVNFPFSEYLVVDLIWITSQNNGLVQGVDAYEPS